MPSQLRDGSVVLWLLRQSVLYQRAVDMLDRLRGTGSEPAKDADGTDAEQPSAPGQGRESVADSRTGADSKAFTDGSLLASAADRVVGWLTASWLYRWLTAEPEPDVIVIDLRETWTVGPFLRLFEAIVAVLGRGATASGAVRLSAAICTRAREGPVRLLGFALAGLSASVAAVMVATGPSTAGVATAGILAVAAAVATRIRWSWAELAETAGYRALAAAFEPPEPPERESGHEREGRHVQDDGNATADQARDCRE